MPDKHVAVTSTASLIIICLLLSLSILIDPSHAGSHVQDPMVAQASSFGWLASRNFTYCQSDQPDPPDKPRGIQPKFNAHNTPGEKRLTGMGDSVVVLYHPEKTNKALAWCNTLVAIQDTEHVQCHIALPTCQRCEAKRSKPGYPNGVKGGGTNVAGVTGGRVPAEKPGNNHAGTRKEPKGTEKEGYDGLKPLQKRGQGASDPNNKWVPLPGQQDPAAPGVAAPAVPNPQANVVQPQPQPHPTRPSRSSYVPDADDLNDPELEAALSEFQDFCENKLTLAVRADCPLHTVSSWLDEPPFDLHRFCMELRGTDGSTLHTKPGRGGFSLNEADTNAPAAPMTPGGTDVAAGGNNGGGGGSGAGAGANGAPKGVVDPNDPVVPFPGQPNPAKKP
ncbi:uncharacterized protein UTRI_10410_B [Ustilago trichophora]|uniref:Uncharacterized protein n=1 Tax=Ustilago trichophora TaxID=86804 RepID=A0A5C3EBB4_9BASI|nr:uncharacterized protein UTRI_10410_B [Ustilago trichophora]